MAKYIRINLNPFNKEIGDCAIRAVSKATDISYEEICKMMNKNFKEGIGLADDGVDIRELDEFARRSGLLKVISYDVSFLNFVYNDKVYNPKHRFPTLGEFMATHNSSKYVLCLRPDLNMNKESSKDVFKSTFHVICADCNKNEYYDRMKNDPKDMIVYGILKATENKTERN